MAAPSPEPIPKLGCVFFGSLEPHVNGALAAHPGEVSGREAVTPLTLRREGDALELLPGDDGRSSAFGFDGEFGFGGAAHEDGDDEHRQETDHRYPPKLPGERWPDAAAHVRERQR